MKKKKDQTDEFYPPRFSLDDDEVNEDDMVVSDIVRIAANKKRPTITLPTRNVHPNSSRMDVNVGRLIDIDDDDSPVLTTSFPCIPVEKLSTSEQNRTEGQIDKHMDEYAGEVLFLARNIFAACQRAENLCVTINTDCDLLEDFPQLCLINCTASELLRILHLFFPNTFQIQYDRKGEFKVIAQHTDANRVELQICMPKCAEPPPAVPAIPTDGAYHSAYALALGKHSDPYDLVVRLAAATAQFTEMNKFLEKYGKILKADPDAPLNLFNLDKTYLHFQLNSQRLLRCKLEPLYEETEHATVFYVDMGTSAVVPLSELIEQPHKLEKYPPFAIPCRLSFPHRDVIRRRLCEICHIGANVEVLFSASATAQANVKIRYRSIVLPDDLEHPIPTFFDSETFASSSLAQGSQTVPVLAVPPTPHREAVPEADAVIIDALIVNKVTPRGRTLPYCELCCQFLEADKAFHVKSLMHKENYASEMCSITSALFQGQEYINCNQRTTGQYVCILCDISLCDKATTERHLKHKEHRFIYMRRRSNPRRWSPKELSNWTRFIDSDIAKIIVDLAVSGEMLLELSFVDCRTCLGLNVLQGVKAYLLIQKLKAFA